jgi:hypothetical protein
MARTFFFAIHLRVSYVVYFTLFFFSLSLFLFPSQPPPPPLAASSSPSPPSSSRRYLSDPAAPGSTGERRVRSCPRAAPRRKPLGDNDTRNREAVRTMRWRDAPLPRSSCFNHRWSMKDTTIRTSALADASFPEEVNRAVNLIYANIHPRVG